MNRSHVLALLVACFVVVSTIAYSDYPRSWSEPPLDELERAGLEVWRRNNCQACHQVHGFGGFHGPDLTNRVTEDTADAEIVQIVALGRRRMPAFDLPEEDVESLLAWLRWLNDFGRARPPPLEERRPVSRRHQFQELLAEWSQRRASEVPPEVRQGVEIWTTWTCGFCHIPFAAGPYGEPDLSARAVDRSFAALSAILDEGSGRMPVTELTDDEKGSLQAFLRFVAQHRSELIELDVQLIDLEPFSLSSIPWFEYR